MARFDGGCHCGAISVAFVTDLSPALIVPRADQCSFCRKHNAAAISDPAGHLAIALTERAGSPYRFGLGITDFHICRTCGVFVAATGADGDGLRGVVSLNALTDRSLFAQQPAAISFDGETIADRQARRRLSWTPAEVTRTP